MIAYPVVRMNQLRKKNLFYKNFVCIEAILPEEMQAPLQSILDYKLTIGQAPLVMQRDRYWCCSSPM